MKQAESNAEARSTQEQVPRQSNDRSKNFAKPEAPQKTARGQSQAQQNLLWIAQTCGGRDPPSKSSQALAKKDAMRLVGLLARAMTVHAWRCLRTVRALRIGKLLVVILSAQVRAAGRSEACSAGASAGSTATSNDWVPSKDVFARPLPVEALGTGDFT